MIAAAVGLAVAAPFIIPLALAMLFLQGRPVFFRQPRIGRSGKPFSLLKLRTMKVSSEGGSSITVRGDARITPLGRWLRRLKLDELPQLWSVLKGDMSFVGPRPDVPGYWDRLPEEDHDLLELRPGITGPATLVFRNEEKLLQGARHPVRFNDEVLFPEKVRLARCYSEALSFITDLKCILLTFAPDSFLERQLTREGWTSRISRGAPAGPSPPGGP